MCHPPRPALWTPASEKILLTRIATLPISAREMSRADRLWAIQTCPSTEVYIYHIINDLVLRQRTARKLLTY